MNDELKRLHIDLNWTRLSPIWAKLEILLGLTGCVVGLLIAHAPDMIGAGATMPVVLGGGVLSVLGGYLALAGHRSHLYQSSTKLAAYVILRCSHHASATPRDSVVDEP